MASFELNAAVSEAVLTAGAAKSRSTSGSRPKMATSVTVGNIPTQMPTNEDVVSIQSQMLSNDVTRNLLLLTMLSGNFSFGNGIAGSMHPLFPGLLPVALPQQQLCSVMPHNRNISSLQQTVPERGCTKLRQRAPSNRCRQNRSDGKRLPTGIPKSADKMLSQHYASAINASSPIKTTYTTNVRKSSKGETLSARRIQPSNHIERPTSTMAARARSIDPEHYMQQKAHTQTSHLVNSRSFDRAPLMPSHVEQHRDSMQSYTTNLTRGEGNSSRPPSTITGKYIARSLKVPNFPTFNEAEAAATLLDMRLGQNTTAVTGLQIHTTPVPSISTTNKTIPAARVKSTQGESTRTMYHGSYGAVDLSTKSKANTEIGNRVSPSTYRNSVVSTTTCPSKHVATYRTHMPASKAIIRDTPRANKHLASVGQNTRVDPRINTTSLVSRYGDYICAFDQAPSAPNVIRDQATGLPGRHAVHVTANQQAFNYKKVICEKFSHCITSSAVSFADSHHSKSFPQRKPGVNSLAIHSPQVSATIKNHSKEGIPRNNTGSFSVVTAQGDFTSSDYQHPIVPSVLVSGKNCAPRAGMNNPRNKGPVVAISSKLPSRSEQNAGHVTVVKTSVANGLSEIRVPSFRDLRQRSRDAYTPTQSEKDKNSIGDSSHEKSFKSSNLYRIRNSALGGSSDSLHSTFSDKQDVKADTDTDSSSSGSDSEASYESDVDGAAQLKIGTEDKTSTVASSPPKLSPTRSRFILSQPKFTLSTNELKGDVYDDQPSIPSANTLITNNKSEYIQTHSSSETQCPVNDKSSEEATCEAERKSAIDAIPELKCDGTEKQNTFKYKFLKALSNPDSKEGFAVDGKHLRALLGDGATCFYHNNKKYVLKRFLKPKESSDVIDETAGPSITKTPRKGNHQDKSYSPEPKMHRKIEPRISVTAVKRSETMVKNHCKPSSKKFRKANKRSNEISDKKSTKSEDEKRLLAKRSSMDGTKISMPHNKRRRRNHEIENLVYEGAGGKTPIPDLSLRDSDVFSNIKLRRREAAKRGIIQTEPSDKQLRNEVRSVLCTKRIKTAAHNRAIANKKRKKSIESKLRKFRKKDRSLHIRKDDFQPLSSPARGASCVRITAGCLRPYVSGDSHDQEDTRIHVTRENAPHSGGKSSNIRVITQEGKRKSAALTDAILNGPTVDMDSDNTDDADIEECVVFSSKCNKVSKRTSTEGTDVLSESKISLRSLSAERSDTYNNHYRRTSRRISQQKRSNDRGGNEKRMDDNEISTSPTNFETDCVQSDRPFQVCNRRVGNQPQRKNCLQFGKSRKTVIRSSKRRSENKTSKFSLSSCFPAECSITLSAAFGDLRPSYSMKKTALSSSLQRWAVGASAMGIKQQLQRDVWRNMTLDMFTNG